MNSTKIIISPKSIMVFFACILSIMFIAATKDVILLLFASFVVASAFYPIVDWLSLKMNRAVAVALLYLAGFLVISLVFIPFFVILSEQAALFMKAFPTYWEHVTDIIYKGEIFIESVGFIPDYAQIMEHVAEFSREVLNSSINITLNIFTGIIMAFTLAFIVLFLLLEKNEIKKGVLALFPPQFRERAQYIIMTISKKVGGYVRGQLTLMFLVGLLTFIGLAMVGLDFALLLGIIAGLLEIVPILGPFLAAAPAVIIALAKNPLLIIYVVAVYLIVQRVENNILTPLILGKFLELHPIIIISAVLMAASTLGIFGAVLSPAIAAVIYVLVQELYIKKINGNAKNPETEVVSG